MTRSRDQEAGNTGADRVVVNIDGLQELASIRQALDGIRDDIAWWINNRRGDQWLPVEPYTAMPDAALASRPDDQTNDAPSATARNHPRGTPPPQPLSKTAAARNESLDDDTQFCCEAPDLHWTGDPLRPGVACMNCGYVVADCGSVVMQPSPEADPDPEPKEQQRGLFTDE